MVTCSPETNKLFTPYFYASHFIILKYWDYINIFLLLWNITGFA